MFFDVSLNKLLNKHSSGWWSETPWSSWHVTVMYLNRTQQSSVWIRHFQWKFKSTFHTKYLPICWYMCNSFRFEHLRALRFKSSWAIWNDPQVFVHYSDVIMGTMTSQITSLTIVYSTVYLGADQRKRPCFASLAFVRGIHRWPVNSPHKRPVTRKMFPFDDVIMVCVTAFNTETTDMKSHMVQHYRWFVDVNHPQWCTIRNK